MKNKEYLILIVVYYSIVIFLKIKWKKHWKNIENENIIISSFIVIQNKELNE